MDADEPPLQTGMQATKDQTHLADPGDPAPSEAPPSSQVASSDGLDDIWEDEPPPPGTNASRSAATQSASRSTTTPDLQRLRTTHVTAGYRDGVAAAREGAVQGGFDEGYLLGAAVGIRAGYLQGVIEGLESGWELGALDAAARAAVEAPLRKAKQELQLTSLLSAQYVGTDGTWRWTVAPMPGEQEPTIGTVADAHPVLQRWNRLTSIYAHKLDVHRREGTGPPR